MYSSAERRKMRKIQRDRKHKHEMRAKYQTPYTCGWQTAHLRLKCNFFLRYDAATCTCSTLSLYLSDAILFFLTASLRALISGMNTLLIAYVSTRPEPNSRPHGTQDFMVVRRPTDHTLESCLHRKPRDDFERDSGYQYVCGFARRGTEKSRDSTIFRGT